MEISHKWLGCKRCFGLRGQRSPKSRCLGPLVTLNVSGFGGCWLVPSISLYLSLSLSLSFLSLSLSKMAIQREREKIGSALVKGGFFVGERLKGQHDEGQQA